jgi:hypothetical protein
MKKYFLSFAICSALLAPLLHTSAHADMVLVDARTLPVPILTIANPAPGKAPKSPPKNTPPGSAAMQKYQADNRAYNQAKQRYTEKAPEVKGAIDLAKYLHQITGEEFPVTQDDTSHSSAIMIGEACPQSIQDAAADLGPDGFIIKTENDFLYICGGSIQGTLYGIYAFLEDQLGCRWWSWNEEFVPRKTAIKLGDLDIQEKPPFDVHDIMSLEAQTDKNNFHYKSRAKSTLKFTGGNGTLFSFLKPSFEQHFEFLPMNEKGERKFNDLHLNYLAPAMPEVLAAAMETEIKKREGNLTDWIYALGQGDWAGGLDQSEESKKVYEDESWTDPHGRKRPGNMAPLLRLANKTSAILQRKHPGIRVGVFPYITTDSPPGKTVPGPNVDIYLPRLRYGITLGIEEAASDLNTDKESRTRSQMIKDSIEQWTKLAPGRMFIWEYGVNFGNFVRPTPVLRSMAQNIKYYHKIGVSGVMIQANYTGFGGDLVVLKNWVWSKLMWNPDLDIDALIKEFCDGYYGPASADIQDYVNTLEDSVRKPVYKQYHEFESEPAYLTPAVLTQLKAAISSAKAKTQGGQNAEYYRRVREVDASLEALELWTRISELAEKDGRLIRTDINTANGGEYTFSRAQELPKYLRGSGLTEFSNPVTQQRGLVPVNGGPLYTLSHGAVTAKVAPYQGDRRLWEVLLNGKVIMRKSNITPGSAFFTPDGEQTPERIAIQGEVGYGSWIPEPQQLQKETFTQDADGMLHWKGSFTQLKKGKPLSARSTIFTAYPVPTLEEAQKYKVEIRDNSSKGWETRVVPRNDGTVVSPPGSIKPTENFQVRITLPDGKTTILDTYGPQAANGFDIVYMTRFKEIWVFVQLRKVDTEFHKEVPGFEREIKFSTAQ